jgi:hypothetical protein
MAVVASLHLAYRARAGTLPVYRHRTDPGVSKIEVLNPDGADRVHFFAQGFGQEWSMARASFVADWEPVAQQPEGSQP